MNYEEDIERSTELLRKALPLMSRQAAGLHPVSYAVWYDYVARANPALCAAVDEALTRHGPLDEARTQELFRRHVAAMDPEAVRRVTEDVQQLLGGMARSARDAGRQTARFGDSLDRLSEALSVESDRTGDALAAMLADTRQMQQAIGQLQDRLAENQREIDRLRAEVRQARQEAVVDPLTGLVNRRGFERALADCLALEAVAAGGPSPAWLLAGDVDHFKQVNDNWGHGFGDQVLQAVAGLLRQLAPAEATVARVGGEEFALLLPAARREEALALAERIRQRVGAARIRRHGSEETLARVTLSLGVTPHRAGEPAQALIERADRALYASKQGGRDRVTELPA